MPLFSSGHESIYGIEYDVNQRQLSQLRLVPPVKSPSEERPAVPR